MTSFKTTLTRKAHRVKLMADCDWCLYMKGGVIMDLLKETRTEVEILLGMKLPEEE